MRDSSTKRKREDMGFRRRSGAMVLGEATMADFLCSFSFRVCFITEFPQFSS